ncbi:MAG: hypothetical protein QOG45_486, partial [Chloroflexota bacterium]|nr:hypothetical protein [Chloroflexota bacterium]
MTVGVCASALVGFGLSGTLTASEARMPASAGLPACPLALHHDQARCMARFLDASGGGLLGGLLGSLGLGTLLGGSPAPAPAPPPTPGGVPHGLTAADLRSAYGITGTGSAGRTVAVVDAMDDPNAE